MIYSKIVLHGISMGGNMAALSATVMPRPVGVVPCLAWTSASLTFTEGVLGCNSTDIFMIFCVKLGQLGH